VDRHLEVERRPVADDEQRLEQPAVADVDGEAQVRGAVPRLALRPAAVEREHHGVARAAGERAGGVGAHRRGHACHVAGDDAHQVGQMRPEIGEHAARARRVLPPGIARRGHERAARTATPERAQESRVQLPHAPHARQHAEGGVAPHERPRQPVVREPAVGEVGHAEALGVAGGVPQRARIGGRARERLLAAHVEPGAQRAFGHRTVQVVGDRDHHGVEVAARDERLPARLHGGARPAGGRHAIGERTGARGVAAAERRHRGRRVAEECRQVHAFHPPARADHADAGADRREL
jgi:hypothetical protein